MKKHDIIEVSCHRKHETEKAILVTKLKDKDVWIPKSQCEIEEELNTKEDIVLIQMPDGLFWIKA